MYTCITLNTDNSEKTYLNYILGWLKSSYGFFHKRKYIFFIFTNNFIDLDILNMSAISHIPTWYNVD